MALRKTFVLSDESVNTYGFAVRTSGISLDNAKKNCPAYFNHETWDVPLGHWENLRFDGNKLLGDLVINGDNERERGYISKIESGDIKGASVGLDPIVWNSEPALLQQGQTRPWLDKSELYEASLAPLPGNKNALALKHSGSLIVLNDGNKNIIPDLKIENEMKKIALKLGLNEDASEGEILNAIVAIQLKNAQADAFQKEVLKDAEKDLSEEQKGIFVELAKTSPVQALQFINLNKKADTAEDTEEGEEGEGEEDETPAKKKTVKKDVTLKSLIKEGVALKRAGEPEGDKGCYDYLQKHNPQELARIHKEEPKKYAKLAADYGNGIRYTKA